MIHQATLQINPFTRMLPELYKLWLWLSTNVFNAFQTKQKTKLQDILSEDISQERPNKEQVFSTGNTKTFVTV